MKRWKTLCLPILKTVFFPPRQRRSKKTACNCFLMTVVYPKTPTALFTAALFSADVLAHLLLYMAITDKDLIFVFHRTSSFPFFSLLYGNSFSISQHLERKNLSVSHFYPCAVQPWRRRPGTVLFPARSQAVRSPLSRRSGFLRWSVPNDVERSCFPCRRLCGI